MCVTYLLPYFNDMFRLEMKTTFSCSVLCSAERAFAFNEIESETCILKKKKDEERNKSSAEGQGKQFKIVTVAMTMSVNDK